MWVDTGINLTATRRTSARRGSSVARPTPSNATSSRGGAASSTACSTRCGRASTGGDLVRAAGQRRRRAPWLSYFYLAHGIGTDSAEMPFVGTDLGPEFDDALVLQPGMVLVLEPVIWDDGHAGHRSEEIVAVTDDGYRRLSRPATLDEGGAWLG